MKYNNNDTVLVSVPLRGFCFSTVPPKSLVIPSLSRPFAERRLKFLFQGAADGLERASALVRQGAERMRLSFRIETVIDLIRCLGADSFFVADFATKKNRPDTRLTGCIRMVAAQRFELRTLRV